MCFHSKVKRGYKWGTQDLHIVLELKIQQLHILCTPMQTRTGLLQACLTFLVRANPGAQTQAGQGAVQAQIPDLHGGSRWEPFMTFSVLVAPFFFLRAASPPSGCSRSPLKVTRVPVFLGLWCHLYVWAQESSSVRVACYFMGCHTLWAHPWRERQSADTTAHFQSTQLNDHLNLPSYFRSVSLVIRM